jgi:DNA-binding response OmpR family regulator
MKSILIVEDDPLNAKLLTNLLEAHGYRTRLAKTGTEGVDAFGEETPDLMLIDVQLPRKNGFEVCFEVKRSDAGKSMPVLLMSAVYTDREHATRYSEELSADGYLMKPFDMNVLMERVHELIGRA